jgi:hypothetical protein
MTNTDKPSKAQPTPLNDRRRASYNLRNRLFDLFPPVAVMAVEEGIRNRGINHKEGTQRFQWSTVRIRNEVDTALTLLQRRYVDNNGQSLSRSDLISIAVMEAMPALVAKTEA